MKILVLNLTNTYNYGSAMMGIILINNLSELLGESIEWIIPTLSKDNNDRIRNSIKKSVNISDVLIESLNVDLKVKNIFVKFFCFIIRNKKRIDFLLTKCFNPDCVIVLGGDDFSEYYTDHFGVTGRLFRYLYLSKRKPVFFIGQTIGPFTGVNKILAKILFTRSEVFLRDEDSFDYLVDKLRIKNKQYYHGTDLAFLDLPKQDEIGSIVQRYSNVLIKDSYITVIPSGLVNLYSSSEQDYIETWRGIINHLKNKYPQKKILLLSHVTKYKYNDESIIDEIFKPFREEDRIIKITEIILPHEARFILSKGYLTISGRMHPTISSLNCNVPVIAFSYSVKYKGVLERGFGLKDRIIESDKEKWILKKILPEFIEKLDLLETQYADELQFIKSKVTELKKIERQQIVAIASAIKITNE